ncbi:hypothetical protein PQ455_01725 [Sphingomonas naphthae]|uniref:Uncharacterized protein n=1 Tax=Sphingomonas naphthae TaxID=1813468 RepID=A0ABY7TP56_9SPHN|nr:hypothetical protein [Sphingomonas naphthae]WCT73979.1 hypothetical protein PQ455_01725 [Sphingomonas naphthae]
MVVGGGALPYGGLDGMPRAGTTNPGADADIFAAMASFEKLAQEMRDTARAGRAAASEAQVSTLREEAQRIRDLADQRLAASVTAGFTSIAGGAMSTGMGAIGAAKAGGIADDATKTSTKGTRDVSLDAAGRVGSISGQIGAGTGNMIPAADTDAKKAEADALAKLSQSGGRTQDEQIQQIQQMTDAIRDMREMMTNMQETQTDGMHGLRKV